MSSSPHPIPLPEQNYLYIQTSQIPQANLGLYTAIDIYKDERIAIFHGEVLTQKEANKRVKESRDQYFMELPNGRILDCRNTPGFAKFANDATAIPGGTLRNNAKITIDDEENICLVATRRIKAGQEVYCSYGKKYWKKHGTTL